MGYQRNKQAALVWKKWRQANEKSIIDLSLPLEVTESEDGWWNYLMHEINVPGYDYRQSCPFNVWQENLRQLAWSWPGGESTALGEAFVRLEHRAIA